MVSEVSVADQPSPDDGVSVLFIHDGYQVEKRDLMRMKEMITVKVESKVSKRSRFIAVKSVGRQVVPEVSLNSAIAGPHVSQSPLERIKFDLIEVQVDSE